MSTIVIPREIAVRMRALSDSSLESAGILFCNTVGAGENVRLLAIDYAAYENSDYVVRSEQQIIVSPEAVNRHLQAASSRNVAYVQVHSHPGSANAQFSTYDDAGEIEIFPTIFRRLPNRVHGSLVLGDVTWACRVYLTPTTWIPARVLEIGDDLRRLDYLAGDLDERRERTIRAVGREGQHTLHDLRVGIVGLGGTGSVTAQELAYLGVRDVVMIDNDVVVSTNLNRLVGAYESDVGLPKVDVARSYYERIESRATVMAIRGDVADEGVARKILDRDMVFCCTDSAASRGVLNWLSYQFYIPMIDMGVEITSVDGNVTAVSGRVQLVGPQRPCLHCTEVVDIEKFRIEMMTAAEVAHDQYIAGEAVIQPAVVSINGIIASLAATMLLGMTTVIPLRARMQTYYGMKGEVRPAFASSRPDCPVCGSPMALGAGDSKTPIWRRTV